MTSKLCKLDESLLAPGDTLANIGECVKTTDIVFVDSNTLVCDNAGAGGKPYCQISQAVASGKSYIRVNGSGSTKANPNLYGPVVVSGSNQISIFGPGRDVDYGTVQAVINGVTVSGGARLTLVGIGVTNNAGQAAVQCSNSSTLYAQNVLISDATSVPSGGIYAANCAKVNIEKSEVTGASGYGVYISGTTSYRIVNNSFTNGGSGAEPSGVRLTGAVSGLFAFNTIANNRQGIQCDASVAVSDSIVTANLSTQVAGNCQQTRIVTTGVDLDPTYTSGKAPRLTSNSMNDTCCVDKGMPDSAKTIKDDYLGASRPQGSGYDIGFHEAR